MIVLLVLASATTQELQHKFVKLQHELTDSLTFGGRRTQTVLGANEMYKTSDVTAHIADVIECCVAVW